MYFTAFGLHPLVFDGKTEQLKWQQDSCGCQKRSSVFVGF